MKLTKVKIENFQSVEDSGEFTIDQVTNLVGKNEAGKTAILEALYKLNPVEPEKGKFDEEEFPRRYLTTYRQRKQKEPANVVTSWWNLEAQDLAVIEKLLGKDGLKSTQVVIRKGYANDLQWEFQLDESKIVQNLVRDTNLGDGGESSPLQTATSLDSLQRALEAANSDDEQRKALLKRAKTLADLGTALKNALTPQLPHFLLSRTYFLGRIAGTLFVSAAGCLRESSTSLPIKPHRFQRLLTTHAWSASNLMVTKASTGWFSPKQQSLFPDLYRSLTQRRVRCKGLAIQVCRRCCRLTAFPISSSLKRIRLTFKIQRITLRLQIRYGHSSLFELSASGLTVLDYIDTYSGYKGSVGVDGSFDHSGTHFQTIGCTGLPASRPRVAP